MRREFAAGWHPCLAQKDCRQAKAVDLAVVPRSLDEALRVPSLAAPDTSEVWVEGKLHLILQVEIGLWQEGQRVCGKLIPQISLDQVLDR